ncbi:MAG: RNA methyltransferase [Bacteroidia bacterium]|nr:RNA methyltransferase [Bacteroidia bacterium]
MLSKARIKIIQSLHLKKYRNELKLFVVEGKKQVAELLTSNYQISCLIATHNWAMQHAQYITNNTELITVSDDELKKVSLLQAPQDVLALVQMPDINYLPELLINNFTVVLDGIQDPGNLGTIVRIADWYGIKNIVCSLDCVDIYNPKTIQATMGSFARVNVYYTDLIEVLNQIDLPVYGALMQGESLHTVQLHKNALLIIGNEGKGISENLLQYITNPITIPKFGEAESLNAGVAAAIICDARARFLNI